MAGDLGEYWKSVAPARRFRVQAVAAVPRGAAIPRVEAAVQREGGFVLDFKMFSDLSMAMIVELTGPGVAALVEALARDGWKVEAEPGREALGAAGPEPLQGTVQVTFPEGDGGLVIPTPAVPG